MNILKRFAQANITLNCQIVACPGVNDGAVLRRSLEELTSLAPSVGSISVVPVGLTKHRDGLYPLKPVDKACAGEIIDIADEIGARCLAEHGSRIVFCGDELYIKAERPIPGTEYYEDYPQLENGVGLMALMEEEFNFALEDIRGDEIIAPFTIATGVSAAPFIRKLIDELAKKCNNVFKWQVVGIKNNFFGESIDVAGLVTGGDLISQLSGLDLGERVFIPEVMLRYGTDVFLDDVSVHEAQEKLGVPIISLANDGGVLLDSVLGV